jgi:predicted O-methyltransferase YrrM
MNTVQFRIHKVLNKYLLDATRDRKDVLAMSALAPLSRKYLPWSQASMRPSGLLAVLNDIVINNRKRVVECGGGISTFYISRLLSERGGHLYSIENDEAWASLLQEQLNDEGLADIATVVYAPLEKTTHGWDGNGSTQWYSEEKLRCIKDKEKIDLLIVDGPAAYSKDIMYARYPAVPFFKSAFAEDYTVVLDDINRQGEQEIAARWGQELGVKFSLRFVDGTIAIGRPRSSFSV